MRSTTSRHGRGRLAALLLVLLTAAVAAVPGAEFTITGRVADLATGQPLESAQVHVPGTGRGDVVGTLTDADGRYTLTVPRSALAGGGVEVRVRLIGYGTAMNRVTRGDLVDGVATVDFALQSSALRLQQVVVTAARAQGDAAPTTVREATSPARFASPAAPRVVRGLPASCPVCAPAPPEARRHPDWNREQYAHITDNPFKASSDHPLSTFSVDVDRASYANVRRFLLRDGTLPPADAVQVEELVNYFGYEYELPEGRDPVAVTTEVGAAPWRPGHRLMRVGLATRPIETDALPPSNLVFLLDVSGSMRSPDKLPLVKRSLRLLVDQMRDEDHVAIAVYAGAAGLVLEPTSGAHKDRIIAAIERLEAGGSTAGGQGLQLAYDVARRHFRPNGNNRVILATDGDFNVGPSSDAAMVRLVEARRAEGTFLTVLGFGTGNLQNEKMQSMAQHGNGNYAYIDGLAEARKVLVGEMGGTLATVAKDVKIQVEFNPAAVRAYRLIGYENRLLAAEDFNDDAKDAGEMGAGHTVTALYEIVPVGVDSEVTTPSVDPLRYGSDGADTDGSRTEGDRDEMRSELSDFAGELAFVKVRYKAPRETRSQLLEHPVSAAPPAAPSRDLRFASAVAGFGMLLRDSEHRGSASAAQVLKLARSGLGADPHGYRAGFIELVEAYRSLAVGTEDDAG